MIHSKKNSSAQKTANPNEARVYGTTSDQNCDKSCGLRLGADHNFVSKINEQQDKLDKRGRKINHLGLTGQEYDRFLPVLKDVILNIFTDPNEEKIFLKALRGMHDKFPDTLNGSKKTMSMFPEMFDYDSRIKIHNPVIVELLDEMKGTQNDFNEIQKFIKLIKPQAAEELVFNSLSRFFYNHRGMFLHSLKLDQYMKIFLDLSTQERKNNKGGCHLTSLEDKIAAALQITEESLDAPADYVIGFLKKSQPIASQSKDSISDPTVQESLKNSSPTDADSPFSSSGFKIKTALRDYQHKCLSNMAERKFNDHDIYSEEDIRSILRICKFQLEARFPGENDFLTILADLKLFFCMEVKCHMNPKTRDSSSEQGSSVQGSMKVDCNLKSAAKQLKKNAYHMAKLHSPILSRGWKFLKVAGIFPDLKNKQTLCSHCRKWVITEEIIRRPGGLQKWWDETGILEEIGKLQEKRIAEGYRDYLILFNRYINLSRIGLQKAAFPKSWMQVQGNSSYISAGYTYAPSNDSISFKDAQNRPIDAFKILCYEPDQEDLLTSVLPRIIFLCDFGSGKLKPLCSVVIQTKTLKDQYKNSNPV